MWAWRWRASRLEPIAHPDLYPASGLIGVERSVERLLQNLGAFADGLPALDCLLYGERGTGKSSAVRAALGELAPRGLRLVEVLRDDLLELPRLFSALRALDGRFVLFCDDLSFDEGEARYRELKAALEGSLAAPPANVRIVATSNRRHLLPERMEENRRARLGEDGELRLVTSTGKSREGALQMRSGSTWRSVCGSSENTLFVAPACAQLCGVPVEELTSSSFVGTRSLDVAG